MVKPAVLVATISGNVTVHMSIKEQVEQCYKEINVYSSHGLFAEAKQKCLELMDLVEKSDKILNKGNLLSTISNKIVSIEEKERSFGSLDKMAEMSNAELDVIRQMICVHDEAGSNEAIWEVAQACMILGHFITALREFNNLIARGYNAVSAAKNILRCHIGMADFDKAISQYKEWAYSGMFSLGQMENIRTFLQELFYNNNIDKLVTSARVEGMDGDQESSEDEFLDVIGVKLMMKSETDRGREVMLDVNYQNGSTFSVVVPKENRALFDYLEVGREISSLEMYSSPIIFTERCCVYARNAVKEGPKNGDFCVSLRIMESD